MSQATGERQAEKVDADSRGQAGAAGADSTGANHGEGLGKGQGKNCERLRLLQEAAHALQPRPREATLPINLT